jgi:hypothetical protein
MKTANVSDKNLVRGPNGGPTPRHVGLMKHIQLPKHCFYSYIEFRTLDKVHKVSSSNPIYWLFYCIYISLDS